MGLVPRFSSSKILNFVKEDQPGIGRYVHWKTFEHKLPNFEMSREHLRVKYFNQLGLKIIVHSFPSMSALLGVNNVTSWFEKGHSKHC